MLYGVTRSRSCRRSRRLLKRKGYAFEEIDIGADEGLLVGLVGRLVGGLDEIKALERFGDLERLARGRVQAFEIGVGTNWRRSAFLFAPW